MSVTINLSPFPLSFIIIEPTSPALRRALSAAPSNTSMTSLVMANQRRRSGEGRFLSLVPEQFEKPINFREQGRNFEFRYDIEESECGSPGKISLDSLLSYLSKLDL